MAGRISPAPREREKDLVESQEKEGVGTGTVRQVCGAKGSSEQRCSWERGTGAWEMSTKPRAGGPELVLMGALFSFLALYPGPISVLCRKAILCTCM